MIVKRDEKLYGMNNNMHTKKFYREACESPCGDYFFMPTEYIADIVNRHYIKQVSEREELKDIFNARQKEIDEYIKLEG